MRSSRGPGGVAVALGVLSILVLVAVFPTSLATIHRVDGVTPSHGGSLPAAVAGGAARPADPHPHPGAGGGQGRLLVTSADPSIVPNDGVRVNVTAFAPGQFPANSAFQVGAEETIGAYEAVFGIFENTGTLPTAFFSVFTNRTDVNVRLTYWVNLGLVAGDPYDFELTRAAGTNWTLTVNGAQFGGSASNASFDFNASSATWAGGIGFSEVSIFGSTPTVPGLLTVPLALAVHRSGVGWYLPVSGATSFAGSGGPQWGVLGRLQHPTLAPGEVETGSQVANQTNGTELWNSGPVDVQVAVSFPAQPIVATTPALVTVEVTQATGAPIPGVSVYLHDSANGTFPLPTVLTNGSGGAVGLLDTPNVTAAGPDRVTATVTLFGYRGEGSADLALTPALHVVVSMSPSGPSVPPGGRITLTFATASVNGTPVPTVLLTFTLRQAGTVAPLYGTTDGNGRIQVVFTAPSSTGDVDLVVAVQNVGQWGGLSVRVHVAQVVAGLEIPPLPELVGIGLVAVAGGLLAVWYVRARHARKQLPEMPLRRYLRESRTPSDGPGLPRTPPRDGPESNRPP